MNLTSIFDKRDWQLKLGFPFFVVGIFWAIVFGLKLFAPPSFNELMQIQGIIEDVNIFTPPEGSQQLRILLATKDGIVRIQAIDRSIEIPRIRSIANGDQILVWVNKDNVGRDFYWVWQMTRANEVIFTYQQMLNPEISGEKKMFIVGIVMIAFGFSFIGFSMIRTYISTRSPYSQNNSAA